MPSSAGIKIGETKQLNVAVTPPDADRSGLSYSAQPEGFVTLKPNAAGLAVTRVGPGDVVIHAALNGHVAEAVASYTAPLAESLELVWAE